MQKKKIYLLTLLFMLSGVLFTPVFEYGKLFCAESADNPKPDVAETSKDFLGEDHSYGPSPEEESYTWLLVKTIIILGSIVAVFYYFFRFIARKSGIKMPVDGAGRVLSILPLGGSRVVQVVDVAGKVLVLGVTDNAINLIAEIESRDEIDKIRVGAVFPAGEEKKSFQDFLNMHLGVLIRSVSGRIQGRKGRKFRKETEYEPDLDYLKYQKKRLKDLNGNRNDL